MKLQVLPYVTVEVDDRLRRRVRRAGERLRVTVRAYLLSAADDVDSAVDTAGDRVRGLCDRAVQRFDTVAATVGDKLGDEPGEAPGPAPEGRPRLRVVGGRSESQAS
jgi:hypothetical protein